MGSIFSIDIYQSQQLEDTLSQLQDSGFKLVGLSLGGEPLSKPKASKLAVVMGSESHGLSPQVQSLLDYKFSIPGHHQSHAESLNLSIATGIALHTLL
jgi:TrmH family RNA methyltransferase